MAQRFLLAIIFLLGAGASPAFAWGCDGHQAIAIIAERLLGTATLRAVTGVLTASRVDPALDRFCGPERDLMADAATWADDQRSLDPATAGWHFINFPRAVARPAVDHRALCARRNCVVDAIVDQFRLLTSSRDARVRANALRFIVHFAGDIHQPLHTITNGDRGGNCMPVTDHGEAPREDPRSHSFSPNLHQVWDSNVIDRLMRTRGLADARALATHVGTVSPIRPAVAAPPTAATVSSWARESFEIARDVTYGGLPVRVPIEPAAAGTLSGCDDNNRVGRRMASLRARLDDDYDRVVVPVILSQMRLAGERLAAMLMAAFPG
jgi:hypothetical protein